MCSILCQEVFKKVTAETIEVCELNNQIEISERGVAMSFPMSNMRLLTERSGPVDVMCSADVFLQIPSGSGKSGSISTIDLVSIYGRLDEVSKARDLLKEEEILKYAIVVQHRPDEYHSYIRKIETIFDVRLVYAKNRRDGGFIILKGINQKQVQEAVIWLLNILFGENGHRTGIYMVIEIPPEYHTTLKGPEHSIAEEVMHLTNTRIYFPDINDTKLTNLEKCQIQIFGTIKDTYNAKEKILEHLPVNVCIYYPYSLPDSCIDQVVSAVRQKHGVHVELTKLLFILHFRFISSDKYIHSIYDARNDLLATLDQLRIYHQEKFGLKADETYLRSSFILQKYFSTLVADEKSITTSGTDSTPLSGSVVSGLSSENDFNYSTESDLGINLMEQQNTPSPFDSNTYEMQKMYEKNMDFFYSWLNRDIGARTGVLKDISEGVSSLKYTSVEDNSVINGTQPFDSEVNTFLKILGLEHYIWIFELNCVHMDIMRQMSDADLITVGVNSSAARELILRALRKT